MLLVLLTVAILGDRLVPAAGRPFFWSAVVLVRTIATNLADLATHDLHLGQPALICGLAAGFTAVAFVADRTRAGTGFWSGLFLAGTLGTVLGDDVSHRLGLIAASLALGLSTALLFVGKRDRYWTRVLAIRTAGTSIADLSASFLGLTASTASTAILLAATLGLTDNRGEGATAPSGFGQSPMPTSRNRSPRGARVPALRVRR